RGALLRKGHRAGNGVAAEPAVLASRVAHLRGGAAARRLQGRRLGARRRCDRRRARRDLRRRGLRIADVHATTVVGDAATAGSARKVENAVRYEVALRFALTTSTRVAPRNQKPIARASIAASPAFEPCSTGASVCLSSARSASASAGSNRNSVF